ncbi:MAG: hypothetical protein M1306_03890, partial [Candidatus Thermoplasmatota archaeon]|nr:hypothetical protein [Candidatus Thermoplasmatota archaeon]
MSQNIGAIRRISAILVIFLITVIIFNLYSYDFTPMPHNIPLYGGSAAQKYHTLGSYNCSGAGFVRCTIDLQNNSIFPGNYNLPVANSFPNNVIIDSKDNELYAFSWNSNLTQIVNLSNNCASKGPLTEAEPASATFDNLTGTIYVANELSNSVSVFNTSTGKTIETMMVGESPDFL